MSEGGKGRGVRLFATPWTIARQAPLTILARKEYWSGLQFPSPGYLSKPGIEPVSLASPALAGRIFTIEPQGKHVLALPELI